uniref:Uncharacterized protein n=1 Tax=Rhizophora mucronata TaxID=61149 RepID=A0A2P2Q5N2_RHIMU
MKENGIHKLRTNSQLVMSVSIYLNLLKVMTRIRNEFN